MECCPELLEKIVEVVNTRIRPSLQMDGGDISVISLRDHTLSVKLHGTCSHCPMAMETLKGGVEKTLNALVSNDIKVIAV